MSEISIGNNGDNATDATIGEFAFYDCTALESVTICKNVTSIYKAAFYGCDALKTMGELYYGGTQAQWEATENKTITIGDSNEPLKEAPNKYYYCAKTDTGASAGTYWCYDDAGEIEIWTKS